VKDPKDADKDKQIEDLKKEIEDMKKQLEELAKAKEEEKPPEAGGGCGGEEKPQEAGGPKGAGDKKGQGDWDTILMQDCAAVLASKGAGMPQMQGLNMGQQVNPMGQMGGMMPVMQASPFGAQMGQMPMGGGMPGVGGMQGLGGQQGGNPVQKLQSDYGMAKSSGAQLKPETEQLVQQTLQMAGGGGMPGMGQQIPGLNMGQQANPLGNTFGNPFQTRLI
jgi:hypothetical protein